MKLTKEILKTLEDKAASISDKFDIEFSIDGTVGSENLHLELPRDTIDIPVANLVNYFAGIDNLEISADRVTCDRFTQMPITSLETPIHYYTEDVDFQFLSDKGYKVKVVSEPILIGIGAAHLGFYDKYFPPCSSYTAIEIEYESKEKKINKEDELNVLKSYLFELSYLLNEGIIFSEMHDLEYREILDNEEKKQIHAKNLKEYTEGMDLFRKGMESYDQEIRFLYFYKIIEYYSPIAAKRMAFEALTRKLDNIRYINTNNRDLEAIFSIADTYRSSQNDKELAQTVLKNAIDIVDLFSLLPERIRTRLVKMHQLKDSTTSYELKEESKQSILQSIGVILYSTRNSIVHAKSNYRSDGNECKKEDLSQLNVFLKEVCYTLINWYSRLPDHIKF